MLKHAVAAALVIVSTATWAADARFEWGIAAGASKVTVKDSSLALDFKSNGFVLNPYIGYQFTPHWAAEGGYMAGGKTRDSEDASQGTQVQIVKNDGWYLSGIGTWPINDIYSVYGRLGYVLWDSKSTEFIVGAPKTSGSSGNALLGIGGGYMLGDTIKLRLEYQRTSLDGGNWRALTLGFVCYL
jgi:OOP family OmpA-OmpF porin